MDLFIPGILVFSFDERTKCCFMQFSTLFVPISKSQSVGKDGLEDLGHVFLIEFCCNISRSGSCD